MICYEEKDYFKLKKLVDERFVKNFFQGICEGEVKRYCLDHLYAMNFVLYNALAGGVTNSLRIDKHGKTLAAALLQHEIGEEEWKSL